MGLRSGNPLIGGDVARAHTNSLFTLSLPPVATRMEACSISPRSCLGYSALNFRKHNLAMSMDARLSFIDSREQRKIEGNGIPCKLACQMVHRVPRRLLLESMAFSAALLYGGPAPAALLPEMKEPEIIRSLKLRSGVKIQDIVEGEGAEAREGDLVEVNYVCRRSNGYFVHSTVDQFSGESRPVILLLDDKEIIQGLKEVLVGMKVGGKRRALIPPNIGYVNENLKPIPDEFGPRRSLLSHAKEPLVFEVQLLNVL